MTTLGVRRCMEPCESFEDASGCDGNCLPDPEDPSTFVCWLGGPAEIGDTCETHYDCRYGACNEAGVCAYRCGEGLLPCSETMVAYGPHVCRGGVCTPEG